MLVAWLPFSWVHSAFLLPESRSHLVHIYLCGLFLQFIVPWNSSQRETYLYLPIVWPSIACPVNVVLESSDGFTGCSGIKVTTLCRKNIMGLLALEGRHKSGSYVMLHRLHYTCIISFNPHNNPIRKLNQISPFRWRNWILKLSCRSSHKWTFDPRIFWLPKIWDFSIIL